MGGWIEGPPDGKSIGVWPEFKLFGLGVLKLRGRLGSLLVMLLRQQLRFYEVLEHSLRVDLFSSNKLQLKQCHG